MLFLLLSVPSTAQHAHRGASASPWQAMLRARVWQSLRRCLHTSGQQCISTCKPPEARLAWRSRCGAACSFTPRAGVAGCRTAEPHSRSQRLLCTAAAPAEAEAPADVQLELPKYCPGCGIRLQFEDAAQPGCVQASSTLLVLLCTLHTHTHTDAARRYAQLPRTFESELDLFQDVDEPEPQEWDLSAAASQERDGIPSTAPEPSTSQPAGPREMPSSFDDDAIDEWLVRLAAIS